MSSSFNLKVDYTNKSISYGHSRNIRIDRNGATIFGCQQIPYPECCGIAILKGVSISDGLTKAEFEEMFNLIIEHLKKEDNFSKVIFYTNDGARMASYLSYFSGAILTDKFKNYRSGNVLVGFEISLIKDKMAKHISDPFDLDFGDPDDEDEEEDDED